MKKDPPSLAQCCHTDDHQIDHRQPVFPGCGDHAGGHGEEGPRVGAPGRHSQPAGQLERRQGQVHDRHGRVQGRFSKAHGQLHLGNDAVTSDLMTTHTGLSTVCNGCCCRSHVTAVLPKPDADQAQHRSPPAVARVGPVPLHICSATGAWFAMHSCLPLGGLQAPLLLLYNCINACADISLLLGSSWRGSPEQCATHPLSQYHSLPASALSHLSYACNRQDAPPGPAITAAITTMLSRLSAPFFGQNIPLI